MGKYQLRLFGHVQWRPTNTPIIDDRTVANESTYTVKLTSIEVIKKDMIIVNSTKEMVTNRGMEENDSCSRF